MEDCGYFFWKMRLRLREENKFRLPSLVASISTL